MRRTPELFEKIESYLENKLSGEEVTAFENEIAIDQELQSEVVKHKELHSTLSDSDTLNFKQKLIKISREVKEEQSSSKRFPFSSSFKIVAAVIVLLGVSALLWNASVANDRIQDLYAVHYTPYPVEDITRGESDPMLHDSMQSYRQEEYTEVVSILENNIALVNQKELQLYFGNSYLNTNQVENAIVQFENISKKSRYYEASRWYLSLAYLKSKNTKKTTAILEEIIRYQGVYKDNAAQLLEALRK